MIVEFTGFGGQVVWDSTKPNGQPRRKLDISRAESAFGFRACTPFEEGVRRTIHCYLGRYPGGVQAHDRRESR
jgi:GDP-L-fucose synthase